MRRCKKYNNIREGGCPTLVQLTSTMIQCATKVYTILMSKSYKNVFLSYDKVWLMQDVWWHTWYHRRKYERKVWILKVNNAINTNKANTPTQLKSMHIHGPRYIVFDIQVLTSDWCNNLSLTWLSLHCCSLNNVLTIDIFGKLDFNALVPFFFYYLY